MTIFQHTADKVLSGEKGRTSLLAKPNQVLTYAGDGTPIVYQYLGEGEAMKSPHPFGDTKYWRTLWEGGRTYSVQKGRNDPGLWWDGFDQVWDDPRNIAMRCQDGQKFTVKSAIRELKSGSSVGPYYPARIKVSYIEKQDVRNIRPHGVKAEGFASKIDFLQTWVHMHDKARIFYWLDGYYHQWRGRGREWEVASEQSVLDCLHDRPAEKYTAWALYFWLLKGDA